MIKLFRKIRYDLMGQNKTGKYLKYAFGEILLVVIGILIALSLNNWNERQKEKKNELVIVNSIFKELKENLENSLVFEKRYRMRLNILSILLKKDKDSLEFNSTRFSKLINRSWDAGIYTPINSNLNNLINSEELKLLSSNELKENLIEYDASVKRVLEINQNNTIHYNTIILPFFSKNYPMKSLLEPFIDSFSPYLDEMEPPGFEINYSEFWNNPEFENILTVIFVDAWLQLDFIKKQNELIKENIGLIESKYLEILKN